MSHFVCIFDSAYNGRIKLKPFSLNNYLIYLAFGKEEYLQETLYSLLTFYKFHQPTDNLSVIVYTHKPEYFTKIIPKGIIYHQLEPQTILQWKGPHDYIYRLKTKVLQDICSKYQGNFLFVDTDTVFLKSIAPLFAEIASGELLLDTCEGRLSDNKGGIAAKTKRFLAKQNTFTIPSDKNPIRIDQDFVAWNSGTIGFTNNIAPTFVKVEELMDELYGKSKLFMMEQLALSYYFQQLKQPKATNAFIHHYWDFKEFRPVLAHFFSHHKGKNWAELVALADRINPQMMAVDKRKYKKMSFLQKQWQKLRTGKKWKIPHYQLD